MKLLIKKLNDRATLPKRATPESAGYDLSACLAEPLEVKAGQTVKHIHFHILSGDNISEKLV